MYKTTDIYLSTTLIEKGANLEEMEVTENGLKRAVVFVLSTGNMDIDTILEKYKNHQLEVDAHGFVNTFKALKSRMYEKLNTY
jgi:hypothetical protein